jgi:hypothetical protein
VRTLILLVATLVVALVSGALLLAPRGENVRVVTTEEIRTSHGGHHHKTICSWTSDDSDDDGADDDDDVAASPIICALTPIDEMEPHVTPSVAFDFTSLGPSIAHTPSVERPPRA